MRSKLLNSKVIFSLLLAGGMVLEPFAVYADANINGADDAAFTCSSAINVMDCINQTQSPSVQQQSAGNLKTAIPVSSQTFGFTGPVSFNVRYDQDLSWILDAGYAQSFGNRAAVALKGSIGQNELRGNGTIGFALSPKQQIKFTYEYLTQNLPFDYAAGTVNEWVSQNAYGAAYRYMLGNSILQGVELSGSYTKANSKELSDIDMTDADGNYTKTDQRRIAGGEQKNGLASVILTPFKNTILKVGAGYSESSFDTKWSSNQEQSTIAYAVEATHLLTPKTLISTSVNNTSSSRAHTVKVSRILPGNIEGNITGQYNVSHVDGIESNANVTAGLSYPAPKTYSNMFAGGIGDLKSWVQQPVIYNARVLAIAEEKILTAGITTSPIPDASLPVNDKFEDKNTIDTQNYFTFDKAVYEKVSYSIATYLAGDPQKKPVDLGLQMTQPNSYDGTVTSTSPLPASTVGNQYTAVITANGYRKGQIVTPNVTDSFTLKAVPNSDASAGQWINATLNSAIPGQNDYNSGLLTNSIGKGLSGDKYTFAIVNDATHKAPDWLVLSSDGQSLINDKAHGKTVPADMTAPAQITLTATSKATGNNVTVANSTEDKQTFTINVNTVNFKTPEWLTSGSSLLKLPNAIQGQDYSVNDVKLNAYTAKQAWTTKTTNAGADLPKDYLTFTLINNNCSSWLTLGGGTSDEYGQDGLLSGTPTSTQPSDCTVTVVVTSKAAGGKSTTFQKNQTIHVNAPTYTQPDWIATGLKNADASAPYEYHLDPYDPQGDAPVLSKTFNALDLKTPLEDKLTNFKFKTLNCKDSSGNDKSKDYSSWLKLDEFGTLSSNVPASASGSCDISVTFDSRIIGTGISTLGTINLPINSPIPTWYKNPKEGIPVTVNYSTTQTKVDIANPYLNYSDNAAYMSNVTVTGNKLNISTNLPSNGIGGPVSSSLGDVNHWYATVNATTADVIGRNSIYIAKDSPYTGQFTVSFNKGDSGNSDPATFLVNVVDDLRIPQVINPGTSALPAADIGQPYPQKSGSNYTLNPYDATAVNSAVLTKTLLSDGKTPVLSDTTLTFTQVDYADSTLDCKQLAKIGIDSSTGKIIPGNFDSTKGPYPAACWLSFTVESDRAGLTSSTQSIQIPINGEAPKWISKGNIAINFDNLGINSADFNDNNDLTKMIDANAAPGLTFAITDDYPHDNWTLMTHNTDVYLVRQKTVNNTTMDATDVGPGKMIKIIASNTKGSAPQTLSINVQPHSDGVYMTYTPALTANAAAPKLHVKDIIQTKLLDGTPVNDLYFMDSLPVVCTGPDGVPVGVSNLGTGATPDYVMDATTALTDSNNLGTYPNTVNTKTPCGSSQLKLTNFYSNASSDKPKSDNVLSSQGKDVKLTLTGQLAWKSTTKDIYFDAISGLPAQYAKPGAASCEKCGIKLNDLLNFNPATQNISNVQIFMTSSSEIWDIVPDANDSSIKYLVRKLKDDGGQYKYLDGDTLGKTSVSLTVSADGMENGIGPINVNIVPDDRGTGDSPMVFSWDKSAHANTWNYGPQLVLHVGDTLGFNTIVDGVQQGIKLTGSYSDNNLIKLCIDTSGKTLANQTCSAVVKNVIIKLAEYDNNRNTGTDFPVSVIPRAVPDCYNRILTDTNRTLGSNIGAFNNATKDGINSYLRLSQGEQGNCDLHGSPDAYTLQDINVDNNTDKGPYTITFSNVRLDPGSNKVGTNTNLAGGVAVTTPTGWFSIQK